MKPRMIRIHHNRRGAPEHPWTLHTSQGCFPCSHFIVEGRLESEEQPAKKTNPRYFLKLRGSVVWEGSVARIYAGSQRA